MKQKIDLLGQKFNKLTVLGFSHRNKKRCAVWECQCDCLNISFVPGTELKSGRIKSCGCLRKETLSNIIPHNFNDLTGSVFGLLTVLKEGRKERYYTVWLCKCECGNVKEVERGNLIMGRQVSCGCVNKKNSKERLTTHGLSKTRMYRIWAGMISRCYNPNVNHFYNYGGRGISVSDEWRHDFMNFYNDMSSTYKSDLTLDRVDVDGNYCKANCRWATWSEQAMNKRNSLYLTIDGETKHAKEWAEQNNKSYGKIHQKHRYGKDDKEAVFGRTKIPIDRMALPKKLK